MVIGWIVLAVAGLLILGLLTYVVVIYNGLIRMKNNIDKSWSNIDVLLKQRFDELPKLVEVCKGYMKHERETLEAVVQARNRMGHARSDKEMIDAQNAISDTLKSLFAVSEAYPQLKADEHFLRLQGRISQLEDHIADRREFYNDSVTVFNTHIEQFPDVLVARPLHFERREVWKIDPAQREDIVLDMPT